LAGDATMGASGSVTLSQGLPFIASGSIVRNAKGSATTATTLVSNNTVRAVSATRKVYITNAWLRNGGTAWTGTIANIYVQDNTGTTFITFNMGTIGANTTQFLTSGSVTLADPFLIGTGGTQASGIKIVGDSTGSDGSDITVTVTGIIK
jgi:hypothetical protein